MPFTVSELRDLIQLLREHPEWRDAVRHELLSDDFLALPQAVNKLAEAQARTERRIEELAQAQARTERKIEELAGTVAKLAEAQARTEHQIGRLVGAQERNQVRLQQLETVWSALSGRMGNVEGALYEQRYRDHAPSRLGARLRRAERVHLGQMDPLIEALDRGEISEQEWDEVASLDLLVRGRAGRGADAPQRYLAVEISVTIDKSDVTRASERAAILARVGLSVEACVAGRSIRPEAEEAARALGVTILLERAAA